LFGGKKGTGRSELAAGVGVGSEHPGSNIIAMRSLAADHPCGTRAPMGAGRDVTQAGGEASPEERHGMAAEVHMVDRRRINPVRRIF
jgi:hypothetical protein